MRDWVIGASLERSRGDLGASPAHLVEGEGPRRRRLRTGGGSFGTTRRGRGIQLEPSVAVVGYRASESGASDEVQSGRYGRRRFAAGVSPQCKVVGDAATGKDEVSVRLVARADRLHPVVAPQSGSPARRLNRVTRVAALAHRHANRLVAVAIGAQPEPCAPIRHVQAGKRPPNG